MGPEGLVLGDAHVVPVHKKLGEMHVCEQAVARGFEVV